MPLKQAPVLILVTEVAAAFVGFSYVVGAVREDHPEAAVLRNSMRGVAELALVAGAGALFALVLNAFELAPEASWRIASIGLAVAWSAAHFYASKRFRRAGSQMTKLSNGLGPLVCSLAGIVLLFWNAVFPSAMSGPRFVLAVSLSLAASALLFVFATFASGE